MGMELGGRVNLVKIRAPGVNAHENGGEKKEKKMGIKAKAI